MNCRHPEIPTRTLSGFPPDNEDLDDGDDNTPGGNLPDDNGLDENPDNNPDDDDDLNPQDRVFLQLSEAIDNLVRNSCCTSTSEDSKVRVQEPLCPV
jgi:hypothetical protein